MSGFNDFDYAKEAKDADIPVIIVDRMVDVSDDSLYTAWVGSNFKLEGQKAAEWLNAYAEAKGMSEVNIAHIQGTIGAFAQIGCTEGLEEAADKYGWNDSIVNHSPQGAQNRGISTVYQEVNLCPNLSVAENLFIGREPRKAGMIDWKTMNKKSGKILKDLDIDVAPTQNLGECSIANQQMIAIERAVDMKCKVLILDEPTSSLDDEEVEKLFVLMNRLKAEGVGIVFVTHFLEQVYAVCDRITVLRNGELVGEYEIDNPV